jgi:predicted tellurium resistance membrane protein TerC
VSELFTVENLLALVTLTALEVVLGIDNVVFLAILTGKLPPHQQPIARRVGLSLALVMRLILLMAISWVMGLTRTLLALPQFWALEAGDVHAITGRDLILFAGGLFLIGKATYEIHDKLEGESGHGSAGKAKSLTAAIIQIALLDMVFSLDSVITAVGMVRTEAGNQWIGLTIMITAVVISIGVMLLFARSISAFVERHPTMKMLALSFLILIGVMLVVEGLHAHIPKGYIYFAMAFSLVVELLNMRLRKLTSPVQLHQSYVENSP